MTAFTISFNRSLAVGLLSALALLMGCSVGPKAQTPAPPPPLAPQSAQGATPETNPQNNPEEARRAAEDVRALGDLLIKQEIARRANEKKALEDFVPCELNDVQTTGLKPSHSIPAVLDYLRARGINISVVALDRALSATIAGASAITSAVNKVAAEGKIQTRTMSSEEAAAVASKALNTMLTQAAAPDDVACSMVMLPWEVAADSFGRHVADQFIAFQVVVRNLNATQEFLMHNVSIAVEEQRFYSGVDKMLVRNTQSHGNAYDRRNFALRALEVAGDIAAGTATYGSADTAAGIGVFRSAFIPGMGKLFRDRSDDQIHALNDLAFSSSMAYKIVVPVKGSAPFVTFLPAKTFSRKISASWDAKKWHYKNWNTDDLQRFTEWTYVIASGVHVQEVHNDQPAITELDCKGSAGSIDLSKADAGTLTCSVRGTNLDKVAAIRLKNTDANDTLTAEAPLTLAGGQNTSATVAFPVKQLSPLKGATYSVYLVTSNKNELVTDVKTTISAVADTAALTVKIGEGSCTESDCSIKIAGTNLTQATGYVLRDSSGAEVERGDIKASDGTGATVQLTRLASRAAGDYRFTLENAGAKVAEKSVKIVIVPAIESIAPSTCSTKAECVILIGGKRIAALTSVSLTDASGKATAAKYDAVTSKATVAKGDMASLTAGPYNVKGSAGADTPAISSVRLTVTD